MVDRDKPRRDKVYAWEATWYDWNRSTYTLAQCTIAIFWACQKYGVYAPFVTSHKDRGYSYSKGAPDNVISFRMDQMNPAVALHEAAHHIVGILLPAVKLDHAPQWLGVYLWLLEGYRVAPPTALRASLRAARLRWTPTTNVSPSRIGRRL